MNELGALVLAHIPALVLMIVGFVLLAIVGIWAFVDLVRILIRHGEYGVDPNGVPLS